MSSLLPTVPDEIPEYASDLNITWIEDRIGDQSIPLNLQQASNEEVNQSLQYNVITGDPLDEQSQRRIEITLHTGFRENNVGHNHQHLLIARENNTEMSNYSQRRTERALAYLASSENDSFIELPPRRYYPYPLVDINTIQQLLFHGRERDRGLRFGEMERDPVKPKIFILVDNSLNTNNNFECCICLEDNTSSHKITYNCGHSFCNKCNCEYLTKCLIEQSTPKCHLCRKRVDIITTRTDEEKEKINLVM